MLRMVGQWIGKARKMAGEFQGQFQEAMREAEMADLKKSFDEVKEAATGFGGGKTGGRGLIPQAGGQRGKAGGGCAEAALDGGVEAVSQVVDALFAAVERVAEAG